MREKNCRVCGEEIGNTIERVERLAVNGYEESGSEEKMVQEITAVTAVVGQL